MMFSTLVPMTVSKRLRRLSLVLAATTVCVGLGGCWGMEQDNHPQKLLTKRRALFKQFTRTLEPMGLVRNGRKEFNRAEFLTSAQDLEKLSDKPWIYFPEDGNYPPTHARAEVWSQPQRFHEAQLTFQAATHALAQTAQQGTPEQINAAVDAVTKSCKACHQDFRNE